MENVTCVDGGVYDERLEEGSEDGVLYVNDALYNFTQRKNIGYPVWISGGCGVVCHFRSGSVGREHFTLDIGSVDLLQGFDFAWKGGSRG